jgi:hypothetical protein
VLTILKANRTAVNEYHSEFVWGCCVESVCDIGRLLDDCVNKMSIVCGPLTVKRVLEGQKRQERAGDRSIDLLAQVSSWSSMFPALWRRRIAKMNSDSG